MSYLALAPERTGSHVHISSNDMVLIHLWLLVRWSLTRVSIMNELKHTSPDLSPAGERLHVAFNLNAFLLNVHTKHAFDLVSNAPRPPPLHTYRR